MTKREFKKGYPEGPPCFYKVKDYQLIYPAVVFWPTGDYSGSYSSSVMEMVAIDGLYDRYMELLAGKPFNPYQVPKELQVDLRGKIRRT